MDVLIPLVVVVDICLIILLWRIKVIRQQHRAMEEAFRKIKDIFGNPSHFRDFISIFERSNTLLDEGDAKKIEAMGMKINALLVCLPEIYRRADPDQYEKIAKEAERLFLKYEAYPTEVLLALLFTSTEVFDGIMNLLREEAS